MINLISIKLICNYYIIMFLIKLVIILCSLIIYILFSFIIYLIYKMFILSTVEIQFEDDSDNNLEYKKILK